MKVYLRHNEMAEGEYIGNVSPAEVGSVIETFRSLTFFEQETGFDGGMCGVQIVVDADEPFLEITYSVG